MKTGYIRSQVALALVFSGLLVLSVGAAPTIIYETGFEATDVSGANFTVGNLDGQGGWQASSATVIDTDAQAGSQSVALPADAWIEKSLSGSGEIWIIGYYKGDGSTAAPSYPTEVPAASIVHFSATDGIQCLDGDGTGSGTWVPASGGTPVSASKWTQIAIHIVYNSANPAASYWDCLVDGAVYQRGLGFRNNSVTSLTGFKNLSGSDSYFDTFRVIASDGDVDGDGVSDKYEIANDTNPLDPSSFPIIGDVNGDGVTTALDGVLQYRIAIGKLTQTTEVLWDVNGDGVKDHADGLLIYRWAIGDSRVPYLPIE